MTWLLGAGGTFAAAALLLLWPVRGLELLDTSPANARAPLGTALMGVAVVLLAGAGAATAAALVVRLRRARGVERQQLKWLTYAGALTVVGGLLILVPKVAGIGHLPGPLEVAGTVLTAGGVCSAGSAATCRAGRWPARRWPRLRWSDRPGAGSRKRSTGASTGAAMTRPELSRRSARGYATRSTSTT